METHEFRVKLLESEVEAVKSYLSGLTSDELQKSSACVDWSVADVVAHLAGQDHALRVRRGLRGDYSAPVSSPPLSLIHI